MRNERKKERKRSKMFKGIDIRNHGLYEQTKKPKTIKRERERSG